MLAEETADTGGCRRDTGRPRVPRLPRGLPHALVTSADVALSTARMAAAGLRAARVRVTAESVGASKPDPEGFLKGAAELGVDPADCVVFEDSGAGIAAGRAAGMRVVGIGPRAGFHQPDVGRGGPDPGPGGGAAPGRDDPAARHRLTAARSGRAPAPLGRPVPSAALQVSDSRRARVRGP